MAEHHSHSGNPIETEIVTYNRMLPELMGDLGRFIAIKGEEVIGIFDSYDEACQAGFKRFTLEPFFVKEITPHEEPIEPMCGCGFPH